MKDRILEIVRTGRLIVCAGPGGVGKTTTSAAIGLRGALEGRRVIVLTIDPARRLANSLGLSELTNEPQRIDLQTAGGEAEAVEGGELWAMMLDQKRAFDEVVSRYASDPAAVRAVERGNFGSMVALLVGQGARHAWNEVAAVAERLGAGITTSLLGKPYVDESLPIVAGTMGHLGTSASGQVLGGCDTLLIIGSNDPWTEFYPPPGAARAVQIDTDSGAIGNRYPVEVPLPGDASRTLQALLPLLEDKQDLPWRGQVEQWVSHWHELAAERAMTKADPVNPERVLFELNSRFPADGRLAVDVGSSVYWYARQLRLPLGVPAHLSSTLASMGCSVPYGIAAKLDQPGSPVVLVTGDGAMQMTGIAELITVSRMWQTWQDPRFVICVLNNRELAEVTWEQREMEGEPRFPASQEVPAFPYAEYARLLGLEPADEEGPRQDPHQGVAVRAAGDGAALEKIPVDDPPLTVLSEGRRTGPPRNFGRLVPFDL